MNHAAAGLKTLNESAFQRRGIRSENISWPNISAKVVTIKSATFSAIAPRKKAGSLSWAPNGKLPLLPARRGA
jgi:hypothetical protein